jgi:hypothetical protein
VPVLNVLSLVDNCPRPRAAGQKGPPPSQIRRSTAASAGLVTPATRGPTGTCFTGCEEGFMIRNDTAEGLAVNCGRRQRSLPSAGQEAACPMFDRDLTTARIPADGRSCPYCCALSHASRSAPTAAGTRKTANRPPRSSATCTPLPRWASGWSPLAAPAPRSTHVSGVPVRAAGILAVPDPAESRDIPRVPSGARSGIGTPTRRCRPLRRGGRTPPARWRAPAVSREGPAPSGRARTPH